MDAFSGFPAGKVRFTPLPDLFFSELLPAIDDLAELKVTLHIFWLLHRRKGYPRSVSERELLGDGTLFAGLQALDSSPPQEAILSAVERAVGRGTLLQVETQGREGGIERWYFANTDQGRRAVERVREGELQLAERPLSPTDGGPLERPNIFQLYEQNVGLLQPIIAEELAQAEKDYPAQWIEEAFQLAAKANVRNWRYISRILERWASRGKDDGKLGEDTEEAIRRRYLGGEYADYIKH